MTNGSGGAGTSGDKHWQRFMQFVLKRRLILLILDVAILFTGMIIALLLGDNLTLPAAVSVIISMITALFLVERFAAEVSILQLEEKINEKNSNTFEKIQGSIEVAKPFNETYSMLQNNGFNQKVLGDLLCNTSRDCLIVSEKQFYSLVNNTLTKFALEKAKENNNGSIGEIEAVAVSFDDSEWKTTPDEDAFIKCSLEMVKAGIHFRRLFILDENEIDKMTRDKEYGDIITHHCRHTDANNPSIEAKIIRDDDRSSRNAVKEYVKSFGAGFFCIRVKDTHYLIYDVSGDGTRGHISIDQKKSKKIVDDFNTVWNIAKDFTDEIHNSHNEAVRDTHCCFCESKEKCDHLRSG